MFKVIGLLKRRPDLTPEAFRDYYETHHRLIGEKYLKPYATRYMRRYLSSQPDRPSAGDDATVVSTDAP